jgi:hypothetical protein
LEDAVCDLFALVACMQAYPTRKEALTLVYQHVKPTVRKGKAELVNNDMLIVNSAWRHEILPDPICIKLHEALGKGW